MNRTIFFNFWIYIFILHSNITLVHAQQNNENTFSWLMIFTDDEEAENFRDNSKKKQELNDEIIKIDFQIRENQRKLNSIESVDYLEEEKQNLIKKIDNFKIVAEKLRNVINEGKENTKLIREESGDNKKKLIKDTIELYDSIQDWPYDEYSVIIDNDSRFRFIYSENKLKEEPIDAVINLTRKYETIHKSINDGISDSEDQLKYIKNEIESFNSVSKNLEELRKDKELKEKQLVEVDNKLFNLLNRDNIRNKFRQSISFAFIILLALVIMGFLSLAKAHPDIAKTIFSGEQGIQFFTLFLIIISIILFGVMGTLGSKELSALLGAISGYILGKSSTPH